MAWGWKFARSELAGGVFSCREICRVLSSSQGFSNHPSRLRISPPNCWITQKKTSTPWKNLTNFEAENSPFFSEKKKKHSARTKPSLTLVVQKKQNCVCRGFQKERSLSFDFLPPRNGRFSQPPRLPFPAFHLRFRPERSTPNHGQRTTPTVFHGWFGRKAVE